MGRLARPRLAAATTIVGLVAAFGLPGASAEPASPAHRLRELDASFHLAMARATHNATIVAMINTLLQRLRPAPRPDLTRPQADRMLEEHVRTFDAIASRDPDAIAAAMETHLRFHERVWELS